MPVTVDNIANTTSGLSYFQVPVTISGSAYTAFHAHAKANGSDIRVTDSDGVTPLNFALEGIDTTNSAVYLVVKVPFIAAGATRTIYVYFGNAAAASTSSYATTIGPSTALTGPTDVYTQSDSANFNGNPLLQLLKNQGGVNGGGASLNGKILCFLLAGANSNADRTNGSIALMSSTDGGATFGSKSIILAADGTNMAEPRAVGERADGTILLAYSCDTYANSSAGQAQVWIAKSTDGGSTWSNLSMSPSNVLTVPWTYHTGFGTAYNTIIEKTAGGDVFLPIYGRSGGSAGQTSFYFLKCPSGSEPTNGSNWVTQGSIAYTSGAGYSEPGVVQVDSTHYLAFFRNDVASFGRDLRISSSSDSGATWSAATALGIPGTDPVDVSLAAVSPAPIKLASGNLLLPWGIRYGTNWGVGAVISTDGGTTWLDRAPVLFASNVGQTSGDGGYPTAVQNADGTICIAYYREVGGVTATQNVARVVCTEDYICNANNIYDGCESFGSLWSHGANATISTTHVHNGTNAIKIDNSAATGGINDYAIATLWGTNPATQGQKVAIAFWFYETANDSNHSMLIKDSTGSQTGNTGNRIGVYVRTATSDALSWHDGTSFHDTSILVPANRWNRVGTRANVQPTSVTGELTGNNVSATTGLGQSGSGGNPQIAVFLGNSIASTHSVTYWIDDVYTHQYTANTPAVTVGAEVNNPTMFTLSDSLMSSFSEMGL